MTSAEIGTIVGQLGASGIFVVGIAIISIKFYNHYEAEIVFLRTWVKELQAEILELKKQIR